MIVQNLVYNTEHFLVRRTVYIDATEDRTPKLISFDQKDLTDYTTITSIAEALNKKISKVDIFLLYLITGCSQMLYSAFIPFNFVPHSVPHGGQILFASKFYHSTTCVPYRIITNKE